ncbi:unnamed protein product [Schistosoma turkestanicum]|nr:unnamed protein product [Schistosoma turkestanicum]
MNTVRVITVRSNPASCQQGRPPSPLKATDTGDHATSSQDSDIESNEDEESCINEKIRGFADSSVSIYELIDQTNYLQQFPSWLGYCGPENKKKYSPTFINRNDNIWELVFSERGYIDMLLIVRDLYMKPFPKIDINSVNGLSTDNLLGNTDLCTALFPCINELVTSHERIFRVMAGLHLDREDHVIPSLGSYLMHLFDADSLSTLSKLYGHFLYSQKRIRQRLLACKNHPQIAAFFQQVKQNPRSSRKSLEDCYMVIVQRWTKVETLLESIIRNTLNDDKEVTNLEISRNAVRSILKSAEAILTEFEYTGKLREFAMNLDVPSTSSTTMTSPSDELQLLNELKAPNAKLLNHGPLYVNPMVFGSGQQSSSTSYEVEGVAMKSCFFMLQKIPDSNRYQLFRGTEMPPILWWGQVYGYFRKSGEKARFGFYILLHSATALTLFRCATVDEMTRWETIFNDGFSQWREHTDTFESLSEEFSKARDEIAEKQKRTEAILELLHQLNDKRLTFWGVWEFISSVLISERLAEMNLLPPKSESQQLSFISSTQHNSNRGSIRVDVTSPPTTPNNTTQQQQQRQPIPIMDILKLHTFLLDLDTYNDLDQLFDLFHEYVHRLSFALLSGPSSSLSRSASDVDGSKRPQINLLKKYETFSAHDNFPVANELRSSIGISRFKSKKRDVHRLSATMASIFRTPSRDKNFSLNNQSSTDSGANGSGGTRKPSKQCQSLSSVSRSQKPSSGPPIPPRPPLTVLASLNATGASGKETEANEQLSPPSSQLLSCNPDNLTDASNSLIVSSQPSSEALLLLGELNQIANVLFPQIQLLRTENVELRSTIGKLEAEQSNWKDFRNRDNQMIMRTSLNSGSGSTTHSDNISTYGYLIDNTTVKQETEKLRQDYENFTKKSQDWEKEYQKQRSSIEREHNKIAKERQLLENERSELEHRQRQYEELRSTLQAQLNMYKKMGLKLTPMNNNAQLQELQSNFNSDNFNAPLNRSNSSSIMTNLIDDYLNELSGNHTETNQTTTVNINDLRKPIHIYSNSDDLTTYRTVTKNHSTNFNRTYTHSSDIEITPRPSPVPSISIRHDHVPEHLRGSLVNQPINPKSSDILSDNIRNQLNETSTLSVNNLTTVGGGGGGGGRKSTPGSTSSSSSLFSDSNPLMKLVDHTTIRTTGSLNKSKKSYRSKSHHKDT